MRYDYRQNKNQPGIELIVRANNKYGAARPGEFVLVDVEEGRNPSTISACMTAVEQAELEAKLEAARLRAEEQKAAKQRSSVRGMVEAGLDRLLERGQSEQAAKDKADADALEAQRLAAEAEAAAASQADEHFGTESTDSVPAPKGKKQPKGK